MKTAEILHTFKLKETRDEATVKKYYQALYKLYHEKGDIRIRRYERATFIYLIRKGDQSVVHNKKEDGHRAKT